MRFDIITIFPEMFHGFVAASLLGKAVSKGVIGVYVHDLRDFTEDVHRTVDDTTYGGGSGMVMKPGPLFCAAEALSAVPIHGARAVVLFSPSGRLLDHGQVREFAAYGQIVLIAARYEGVDERVRRYLATHEVSIGDYVLAGGELPAMVFVEAVSRLVPGVVGNAESVEKDSFYHGILDYPHYTRPASFRGYDVPAVLQSGNHRDIELWRRKMALKVTLERRPDLLAKAGLSDEDRRIVEQLNREDARNGHSGRHRKIDDED
jgi:tRNA (guanine37-N1)-methyltransferase